MTLTTIFRMMARDWRGGELLLLGVSLAIAVSSVTSVGLLVDRLGKVLIEESADFLAADRRISSSLPIPNEYDDFAKSLGLQVARTISFVSMVHTKNSSQLVSIKAVSPEYPLKGSVRVADVPFSAGIVTNGLPNKAEVWLDGRLFPILGVSIGDNIEIGVANFNVSRVIVTEPDRGGNMFDLGPRVLMRLSDLQTTDLIQPGSRLTYRLLISGEARSLGIMEDRFGGNPNFSWQSVRESSPSIGAALDRAESFLLIGGLLAVILASLSVAMSARRYVQRHFDHVAIMKTLGATPNQVTYTFAIMIAMIAVFFIFVGLLLGVIVHLIMVSILQSLVVVSLPLPTFEPLLVGLFTGIICAVGFIVPPIFDLRDISPMRVMQRDLNTDNNSEFKAYMAAIVSVLILLVWYSGNLFIASWILLGGGLAVCMFWLVARVLLRMGRMVGMRAGSGWRLALAGLHRRGRESSFQIIIFGLAIMLLLVLYLLRTELLEQWDNELPIDSPNHFVLNITQGDVPELTEMLLKQDDNAGQFYPMIRGRVVGVNGLDVGAWEQANRSTDPSGPRLSSERNLTYSAVLPTGNSVVSGEWWSSNDRRLLVSLERDYAISEGLGVGDFLEFDIAGIRRSVQVANIRTLDWQSMRPNFFIIFSPNVFENISATFLTSFHLAQDKKDFLNELLTNYPTLTVIEVDAIIMQLKKIIARVSEAIEVVLIMIIFAGLLALVATIQASKDSRMQEHSLLRALGGKTFLIRMALGVEFAVLGFLAGVVGALGAEMTVAFLQHNIFNLPVGFHWWVWWAGPLIGSSLIFVVGFLATRSVVSSPPLAVLRDS